MLLNVMTIGAVVLASFVLGAILFARWGVNWGSTTEERAARMTGDDFFSGDAAAYVAMTRAIDVQAPPETVWPWLAQAGRGAGWYSYDRLDNGGMRSARHIVSWIPQPAEGDATAIGYLRQLEPGRQLTWWAPGVRFPGVEVSLAVDMRLRAGETGSRLVIRISADAVGPMARPALWIFRLIDSVMATRQLIGFKRSAETWGRRTVDPQAPETGGRAQYQLYQVVYSSGEWAGSYGREQARRWHRLGIEAREE